jgi:DNA primase
VAGRILEKSIQEVREKARIEDVVGQYVTLRNAGGGSLKGLCPFHDEKSPSFQVTPARGLFYCFGCQAGGDVIGFVQRIDGLGFAETIERLADKAGVALEREEGDSHEERPKGPGRGKLVEAHKLAAEFFAEQLLTPPALPARQFLAERSFDHAAAQQFGVGFAPTDGKALYSHLRGRGFTEQELVTAGLVGQSGWDRFRGRLIWPIRESNGDVIGFGARKLFDDDRIPGKYINTSETPIYKKNQVLYGIDLARQGMRATGQAVVVEGYTDVMACRFMGDFDASAGEVVFTFDGDKAGQAAALKVFAGDQEFLSQTYVAVAPDGLDPCDLRIKQGDEAVRDLIAHRQPLYRFVLGNVVSRHDLDRADGRIDALREGARLVSSVRDRSKVDAFARELAQMVGVDPNEAQREVRRHDGRKPAPEAPREQVEVTTPVRLDPNDPRYAVERETLKLVVQHPLVIGRTTAEVGADDFTHPAYRAAWELVAAAGGPIAGAGDASWATRLRAAAGTPALADLVSALAVEPLKTAKEVGAAYVLEHVVRLLAATSQRRIFDVKSRLQRADPSADPDGYRALFAELAKLEQHRRALLQRLMPPA